MYKQLVQYNKNEITRFLLTLQKSINTLNG